MPFGLEMAILDDDEPATRVTRSVIGGLLAIAVVWRGIAQERRERASAADLLDRRPRDNQGRSARTPAEIPRGAWLSIIWRTLQGVGRHNISIVASGVGFYGLLALFPGLAAFVSLFGLLADPATVAHQAEALAGVLPVEATQLIEAQLQALIEAPRGRLSLGLGLSIVLAVWSARSGASSFMTALNIAYQEEERRTVVMQNVIAMALTVGTLLFGLVALSLIALVPIVLGFLPLPESIKSLASFVRWPVLAALFMLALGFLYRFAPCRAPARLPWVSVGAAAATALWLIASTLFSLYVTEFGSYDKTYGSLGAVVVLLMWFYLTAFVILIGAELNAEAERQTVLDTTDPPARPLGWRRARAADTVADLPLSEEALSRTVDTAR